MKNDALFVIYTHTTKKRTEKDKKMTILMSTKEMCDNLHLLNTMCRILSILLNFLNSLFLLVPLRNFF